MIELPQWITDLDAAAEHHVTKAGGVDLHWRVWGQGEPLVLLHGGSGSWMHFVRNIGPLSTRYRVIAPDMPGFADSGDFDSQSLDEFSGLLAEGLREIETGPVRIAGFSFGSVIGLGLLGHGVTGPDYVMLGSPVLGQIHPVTDQLKKWRGMPIPEHRFEAHRNNVAVLMLADPAGADDETTAIQMAHAERARGRHRGMFEGLKPAKYLAKRAGKLTVIYGDRDALCWRHIDERRDYVTRLDGETEFVSLPGMGHWICYEAANEVNRRLLDL